MWKGWVDLNRLDGCGAVEYDEDRAMVSLIFFLMHVNN